MHSVHGNHTMNRAPRRARQGAHQRISRWSVAAILIAALLAVGPSGVLAGPPPPIPSSFYGTVTVNGQNVADGTLITAGNNGVEYVTTETYTREGISRYRLNVPGDDSDTPARDGGSHGEALKFTIGALTAEQTGTWQSGSNVALDLTASGAWPTVAPTPTLMPTATPSTNTVYLPLVIK